MRPLPLIGELLAELSASGISYCHWKSNHSLDRALRGEADLDLLVDAADRARFEACLHRLECVRLAHTGPKRLPGITDFLGFDATTGRLVHLHVHYRLVLGEQRVKNHLLPVERWLLDRTRELGGVRVPEPAAELLLLYVRSILKSDRRACARARRSGAPHPFPAAIHEEMAWRAGQATDDEVMEAWRASGLGLAEGGLREFLRRLRSEELSPDYVQRQKRALLRELRRYQRYPTVVCALRRAWLTLRYSRPARALVPLPRKRLAGRGLFVALAGADGCGKTTLAGDLPKWLGWKVQSSSLYFGQPKRSLAVRWLRKARRLPVCGGLANSALWLYVARHRRRFGERAARRVAQGHVVFAERFPLRDLWAMEVPMDGPRLARGRLAALERSLYERIPAPGAVLLLSASLETLRERKPDTPVEEHRAKVRAVEALARGGGHEVIDAEQPYAQVLLEAKRRVWRHLVHGAGARAAAPRHAVPAPAGRG